MRKRRRKETNSWLGTHRHSPCYLTITTVRWSFPSSLQMKYTEASPHQGFLAKSVRAGIQKQVRLLLKPMIAVPMTPHELGTICLTQSVYCYILVFLKCVSILSFQIHILACGKLNRNTNYASLFHPFGVYYGSFPAHNRQSIIPTFVSLTVHRGHGHNWDINPELLLTRVIIDAEIIECSAPDRTVILLVVGTWRDKGLGTDILFFSRSGWRNNLKWDTLVLR